MDTTYLIAIGFFFILTVISFVWAMKISKNEALLRKRFNEITNEQENYTEEFKNKPIEELSFKHRILYPYIIRMSNVMTKIAPKKYIESLEQKIIMAGSPKNMTAIELLGIQGLLCIILPIVALIYFLVLGISFSTAILLAMFFGVAGYLLPKTSLDRKIKKRKEDITKNLPFSLDLLTVSVDAGLGFESAMDKVSETMDGPIAVEFSRVLTEIRIGKNRKEALRNMVDRTDVRELSEFVVAIIQADKLGVGLSKLLKVQAKQMRMNAKQRAQEKAYKAPVKMLFPMILFIFPSMFVILLGPALMHIPELLGGL